MLANLDIFKGRVIAIIANYFIVKIVMNDLKYLEYEFSNQDSVLQVILNKYSGYSVQIDGMIESGNHMLGISATLMGPMNVNLKSYYDLYSIYDPIQRYLQQDYSFISIESSGDLLPYETYYELEINEDLTATKILSNASNRINELKNTSICFSCSFWDTGQFD